MLSLTLIYLQLFFPDSLNLLAHSLSLCHPQLLYFFIWIFSPSHSHPVHNSSPDQSVFLYRFSSPEMEMEMIIFYLCNQNYWTVSASFPLHCVFFHNFQIRWEIGVSKTKISYKDVLRFSQSLTGCCYFKTLSFFCELCCLWQIYRLTKTTILFEISYSKIVNILVFAWSAKCGGNFIVYQPS